MVVETGSFFYLIIVHLWGMDCGVKRTLKKSQMRNPANSRIALIQRKMDIPVSGPVSCYPTHFCGVYSGRLLR